MLSPCANAAAGLALNMLADTQAMLLYHCPFQISVADSVYYAEQDCQLQRSK